LLLFGLSAHLLFTAQECFLSYGVPMVAIPITDDQPGVAARIAWTGVGELIKLSSLSVCHGSASLVNLQLADGTYLVAGKKISCFTNQEEAAVGLTNVVPFLLESKLIDRGATVEKAANFQKKVVISDRLVTGQNPASAAGVGEAMVKLLKKLAFQVAA